MKRYRLVIDLSSAQPNDGIIVNGGGQYAENIFYYLINEFSSKEILCLLNRRKGNNQNLLAFIDKYKIDTKEYLSVNELQEVLNDFDYDTAFIPVCYPEYSNLELNRKKRIITTIHDLSSIYADEWGFVKERYINSWKMNFKQLLKYSFLTSIVKRKHIVDHRKICDLTDNQIIITVSEFSKEKLVKYSKKNIDPIVLYPYLFEQKDIEYTKPIPQDYFFLVGGNRWHKNNYYVAKSIDDVISFNEKFQKMKFVIAGMDEPHIDFYKKNIKHIDNFIFKEYISKYEYYSYLKYAKAFIYPSLFEGFGAPPVEAMGIGTLTLCSNASCIPEICGDASIYFDPTDSKSLIKAIDESFDSQYSACKIHLGKNRFEYIFNKQNEDIRKLIDILKGK